MALLQMSALLCTVLALRVASGAVIEVEKRSLCLDCPQGWTSIGERCFQYFPFKKSWAEAELHCLSVGGNLASVSSADEHTALWQLLRGADSSQQAAWLGGSDCQKEGTWLWSDGSVFKYTGWNLGEPNNLLVENCLHMGWAALSPDVPVIC
ncbi:ladderlectin isoform X2 [Amia ocellicauda]|uniref:ladderlectin isoform X2 n=1 Tax=Amia ocellicauda TaxID=2972642 RepID=UPI00346432CA